MNFSEEFLESSARFPPTMEWMYMANVMCTNLISLHHVALFDIQVKYWMQWNVKMDSLTFKIPIFGVFQTHSMSQNGTSVR